MAKINLLAGVNLSHKLRNFDFLMPKIFGTAEKKCIIALELVPFPESGTFHVTSPIFFIESFYQSFTIIPYTTEKSAGTCKECCKK